MQAGDIMIENIVIGKPLVSLDVLLGDEFNNNFNYSYETTEERYLPKILVEYKFIKSIRELKRNRKDLDVMLCKPDCLDIKIGKKRVYIVVGE